MGRTPWGEAINIAAADSDPVRRYFIDCALRWMRDFGIDGLRLDAVHALVDTTAVHLLEELAAWRMRRQSKWGWFPAMICRI